MTSKNENDIEENSISEASQPKKGHPAIAIATSVAILAGMSFLPWSTWTNGYFKDFNLLSDLMPKTVTVETGHEQIDPAIDEALKEEVHEPQSDTLAASAQIKPEKSSRVNGEVVIEDYTPGETGLAHFNEALAHRSERPARVAIIGDSYIEGDIFSANVREALQDIYGGGGVGYMYMQTDIPGFRTSINQSCSGWTEHNIKKKNECKYATLSGEYFISSDNAKTTFKGASRFKHVSNWNTTKLLYISHNSGIIKVSTDNIEREYPINASESVQCLDINGTTSKFEVKSTVSGMVILGAYLNNSTGVVLDCMSVRGNSGVTYRNLDLDIAQQMRQFVDYDLIIIEFGINALSVQQTDYSAYEKIMVNAVNRIKSCYPSADILIMGIGDRGEKIGGELCSIPTAENMVSHQRDIARKTGSLFWDTREAMGGDGAAIQWREQGFINADYIHLNAKGGAELSKLFIKSLTNFLK